MPAPMQLVTLIVVTKALAGPGCLLLAMHYENWNLSCAVQLAIRSVYGVSWILQHYAFPTKSWDYYPDWSVFFAVGLWLGILVPGIDYLCVSNPEEASFAIVFGTVFMFSLGLLLMMVSDSATRTILKHKRGLITTGFNAYMRHPNYLGETLIYASFCINARSLKAFGIMAFGWISMVIPSMMRKEKSLSKYGKEWEAYCQRAGLMWPKL